MKKSILSLLLACFLQINLAFAQNVMKGVVSDANGPLVGVVIHDKDNAKGTPICRESMRSMALNQAIQ